MLLTSASLDSFPSMLLMLTLVAIWGPQMGFSRASTPHFHIPSPNYARKIITLSGPQDM
jgi:hypothetical protein